MASPLASRNARHRSLAVAMVDDLRWRLPLHRAKDDGSSGAYWTIPDAPSSRSLVCQRHAGSFPYGKYPLLHPPLNKLGRYVEELGSCSRAPSPKLMDKLLIGGAIGEGAHYVGVDSIGELVSLLRKLLDVVP